MTVLRHRIAASAILVGASLGLVAVGRTMVQDSPAVAQVRHDLDGRWVATRVQAAAHNVTTGREAGGTSVEFAGRSVWFRGLIEGMDTAGTYVVDPKPDPGKIDFKVGAGWMLGSYSLQGDRLTLCVNAMKLPEQLGVPTRGRPESLRQTPGRYVYEFRRAMR